MHRIHRTTSREYTPLLWISCSGRGRRDGDLAEISSTRSRLLKKQSVSSHGFFRIVPERIHLFDVRLLWRLAPIGESIFHDREPLFESLGRIDECVLRIDAELSTQVHDREQQIADLFVHFT